MQYENSLALRCSLETGMRIGDVLALEQKQLQGRTITYTAQKTGKKDKKVVSADLAKRLKQISGKKWIFEGRFGNKPRTRQAVWKDVKRSAKQLKLDGNISCHSARKTYAVEEFKDGGLSRVQKDLQHTDVNTTMLYAFADLIDKHSAVDKIDVFENKCKKTVKKEENTFEKIKNVAETQKNDFSEFRRFAEYLAEIICKKLKENV